jgi:hypothetical protein
MDEQTWNSKDYQQNARFVSDLGTGLLELLAPKTPSAAGGGGPPRLLSELSIRASAAYCW